MAMTIEGEYEVVAVEQEDPRDRAEQLRERLTGFVHGLQTEVERRIGRKREWEQQRLQDLRQYYGRYEGRILQQLRSQERSELFLNVTGHKTDTAAAKLYDMLFPTDDKNWAIGPTPVPRIGQDIEAADNLGMQVQEQANSLIEAGDEAGAQALVADAQPVLDKGNRARMVREAARQAARGMEDEIDDQFRECDYNAECRKVIEDACQLGTGVIMGPVKLMEAEREWRTVVEGGREFTVLVPGVDRKRPAFYRVDPWHFFPDPDATDIRKSNGVFLRHLDVEKDLRALSRLPGYDKEGIKALLREKPKETAPYWVADLRTITEAQNDSGGEFYHRFTYYGALDVEQLCEIARAVGRIEMAEDYEDMDPLTEVHVCIEFCQGRILKFAEHPLDTNEVLFSVFCWKKDRASIFGVGIPYIMRDQQAAICAGWRMIMDNAGLSTAPQIVIDKHSIEPQDGDWKLRPRKIWLTTRPIPTGHRVFETHDIPADIAGLLVIVNTAMLFVDDETGITKLAQGEQGASSKTFQGMALLMNSTNVVFRRVVRSFDDDLTKPNVRRAYAWNMQWGEDSSIKGDFMVDARGSSVLLVREIQAQNMAGALTIAMGDPELRAMTKLPNAYRSVLKVMQIPVEEWVLSDEEIAEAAAAAANQPPPPNLEMEKIAAQREAIQVESQTKLQLGELTRQIEIMKVIQTGNAKLDEIEGMLERTRIEVAHKERNLAVETAMAEKTGVSAGGSV